MIYAFDVQDGSIVWSVNNTEAQMRTMVYDPVSKLTWGVGYLSNNGSYWPQTLVTLNGDNGQLNVVGK
jgi:hypothetical protein